MPVVVGYRFKALDAMCSLIPLRSRDVPELSVGPRDAFAPATSDPKLHPFWVKEYEMRYEKMRIKFREAAWAAAIAATVPRPPSHAAVCILGMARSLREPKVYQSIKRYVVNALGPVTPHTFHLWDFDLGRLGADFADAFAALPPAEPCTSCHLPPRLWRVPNWTCALPSCGHFFLRQLQCMALVESFERRHGIQIDWVIRVRPDVEWGSPIGPLSALDENTVYVGNSQNVLRARWERRGYTHGDWHGAAPRHLAWALLGVAKEPKLCERAQWRMSNTHLAEPYFYRDNRSYVHCEVFLDLRLDRMQVPVSTLLGQADLHGESHSANRRSWSDFRCENKVCRK